MAGLEGHPLGIDPETRHHRTIVTDLRDMARALDASEYIEFFVGAWGLMGRPEIQDPEVSALLKEFGSQLTNSDQWQEAGVFLLDGITIAHSQGNAVGVRRHFDLIESLGLVEKLSENPEDAEQLATLWDQYMGEGTQDAQATVEQSRQLQQEAAEQVTSQRQQKLDQIRYAQYPGFPPAAEAPPQPAYIPPETVYPPNKDGVAEIPPNTIQKMILVPLAR